MTPIRVSDPLVELLSCVFEKNSLSCQKLLKDPEKFHFCVYLDVHFALCKRTGQFPHCACHGLEPRLYHEDNILKVHVAKII